MSNKRKAGGRGKPAGGAWCGDPSMHFYYSARGVALQIRKRGRVCTIGKIVRADPLGEIVLAMPYRNRQTVGVVSVPVAALAYARQQRARFWVVRFDGRGECYGLPLEQVDRIGWLRRSDGQAEWFVPLVKFERLPWQEWPFVEACVMVGEDKPEPAFQQLGLLG